MGMPIVVDVRDEEVEEAVLDRMFDWLRWVDATFSTFRADSEISRLNRGLLALDDAHEHVRDVLARCEELRHRGRPADVDLPVGDVGNELAEVFRREQARTFHTRVVADHDEEPDSAVACE